MTARSERETSPILIPAEEEPVLTGHGLFRANIVAIPVPNMTLVSDVAMLGCTMWVIIVPGVPRSPPAPAQ
jgi:hypothetical protein